MTILEMSREEIEGTAEFKRGYRIGRAKQVPTVRLAKLHDLLAAEENYELAALLIEGCQCGMADQYVEFLRKTLKSYDMVNMLQLLADFTEALDRAEARGDENDHPELG